MPDQTTRTPDSESEQDPIIVLWEEDRQKRYPSSVITEKLIPHLIAAYKPLWDASSNDSTYHKQRTKGLHAYARYEAEFRIRQSGRNDFDLEQYMQFHLFDSVDFSSDFYEDFMDYQRRTKNKDFFLELANTLKRKGKNPNLQIRFYAMLYDRAPIPLEFWTNQAAADFLSKAYRLADAKSDKCFTRDQVKKWKQNELKLKETKPIVVRKFIDPETGGMVINKDALLAHRIPVPEDIRKDM